ncbi:MAG TPA: dioxygenase [Acidimicrobiales bacterium]|nr:dioxygenase [Acidimicrobiales bacterium]
MSGGGASMDAVDEQRIAELTAMVRAQVTGGSDARLAEIFDALVRHLHAFVGEVQPSDEEWGAAIEFLTRVGQFCTPTRQEFILLSDTLGVSSLVNVLNSGGGEFTESTVLGPFFVAGAPEVASGSDLAAGAKGTPLHFAGEVRGPAGEAVAGALVDTWQSDTEGFYDTQRDEGTRLRARLRTDAEGRFSFWSVVPSSYPIPQDGPVGVMLAAQGRHPYRPAHLHFKIAAPGYRELVTHLFPSGDRYLDSDAVFAVAASLVKDLEHHPAGTAPDGRVVEVPYDSVEQVFVLNTAGGAREGSS